MRRHAVRVLLATLLAGLVVHAGTASSVEQPSPPPRAHVTVRGLTAVAALGSYCTHPATRAHSAQAAEPAGGCSDAAYPLRPNGRLPVRARNRMRIDFRKRARSVTARLVRVKGKDIRFVGPLLRPHSLRDARDRWKVRLPHRLRRANIVSIQVEYPDGDANFWAALRAE